MVFQRQTANLAQVFMIEFPSALALEDGMTVPTAGFAASGSPGSPGSPGSLEVVDPIHPT